MTISEPFESALDALHLSILTNNPHRSDTSTCMALCGDIERLIAEYVFGLDARTQAKDAEFNLMKIAKICSRWLVQLLDVLSGEAENGKVEKVAALLSLLSGRGSSGPVTRKFRFDSGLQLSIKEPSFVEADIGWATWGAAILAGKLIDAGTIDFSGQSVLELGCGTGLAGLMAHIAGHAKYTVLTDYNEAILRNVEENIRANIPCAELGRVTAKKLDWREHHSPESIGEQQFDTLLAADCIFDLSHGLLVPRIVDSFLRTTPRDRLTPTFHAVLPLREKYTAEIDNFESQMDLLVQRGRLVLEKREELEMEEDATGLRYRRYRYVRPLQ